MNNVIFCGPPGTGKTYIAKKNALEIVWNHLQSSYLSDKEIKYYNPSNFCEKTYNYLVSHYISKKQRPMVRLISMHDGMLPSDLLEGINVSAEHGDPIYEEVDKVVLELIQDIEENEVPGIIIFDDINRVSLAGVVGELLYAVTHRNEKVTLSTGRKVKIPNNLYVLMTMNTLMPQYKFDNSLANSFSIQGMKNDKAQLISGITEWSYKELYFSHIENDIDSIVNAKSVIQANRSAAEKDGNFLTDKIQRLLDINYYEYLSSDTYTNIADVLSNFEIEKLDEFIFGSDIKKPRNNKEIKEALKQLILSLQQILVIYEREKCNIENLLKKAEAEWERYNSFIVSNLSLEYERESELYKIGYSYFMPPSAACLRNSSELLTYKIRGQIIPLIKQYIIEGILRDVEVPSYETTATRYSFESTEERILFPELAQTQSYIDTFESNMGSWEGLKNPMNTSQAFNTNYSIVFSIAKSLIDAHIISDWQMMDILCRDTNIMNRMSNDDIHSYIGCLLATDKVAATILAGDNSIRRDADGNPILKDGKTVTSGNRTLPAYSPRLHKLVYRNRDYYFYSKIDFDRNENDFSVDKCREKGLHKGRRNLYEVIKVLVYDVILKYRENIYGMLKELDRSSTEYVELYSELAMIDDALTQIDTIRWYGSTLDEKRYNLYSAIINLDFWNNMIAGNLKGVYMILDDRYQSVMDATGIHQMILQGPPGTSKTYGAKSFLAKEMDIIKDGEWNTVELEKAMLVSKTDEAGNDVYEIQADAPSNVYWDIIQFHPSYTYEDFVRGITVHTPKKEEGSVLKGVLKQSGNLVYDIELEKNSSLIYKTVNKALGKMAEIAKKYEGTGKRFYLIIDEINRANLASVFGELIYALEYRGGKGVSTPYSIDGDETIAIPNNMYIIGTMNTADKSIASIDYAIRRRFLFFPILPNINVVYENVQKDIDAIELKLFYITKKYFEKYYNEDDYNLADIEVGHTFFLRKKVEEKVDVPDDMTVEEYQMKMRYLYQVIPVLKEYINDGMLLGDSNSSSDKNDYSDIEEELMILLDMLKENDPSKLLKKYEELVAQIKKDKRLIDAKILELVNAI